MYDRRASKIMKYIITGYQKVPFSVTINSVSRTKAEDMAKKCAKANFVVTTHPIDLVVIKDVREINDEGIRRAG